MAAQTRLSRTSCLSGVPRRDPGRLERHFGVRLAFQNYHRVAAFRPDAGPAVYAEFTSLRSKVLNQFPELRNC